MVAMCMFHMDRDWEVVDDSLSGLDQFCVFRVGGWVQEGVPTGVGALLVVHTQDDRPVLDVAMSTHNEKTEWHGVKSLEFGVAFICFALFTTDLNNNRQNRRTHQVTHEPACQCQSCVLIGFAGMIVALWELIFQLTKGLDWS